MNREEKNQVIDELVEQLSAKEVVYLTDVAELDAEQTSKLRRLCFSREISMRVVKNTLLRKAMEKVEGKDYSEMFDVLKGNTSIMLSDAGNAPAKLIKDFRKKSDKPILKAAYVEETVYIGDDQLDALSNIKSKNELIADVVALLQSPVKNVMGALDSGKSTLAGLVKTLSERAE